MPPTPNRQDGRPHFLPDYSINNRLAQARDNGARPSNGILISPTRLCNEESAEMHNDIMRSHQAAYKNDDHDYFNSRSAEVQTWQGSADVEQRDDEDNEDQYTTATAESFPVRPRRDTATGSQLSASVPRPVSSLVVSQPMSTDHAPRWPSSRPTAAPRPDNRLMSVPMPNVPPPAAQSPTDPVRATSISFQVAPQRPAQASGSLPSYHSARSGRRSTSGSLAYSTSPGQHGSPQQYPYKARAQQQGIASGMTHSQSMPRLPSSASTVHVGSPLRPMMLHNDKGDNVPMECELGMVDYDDDNDEKHMDTSRAQSSTHLRQDEERGTWSAWFGRMVGSAEPSRQAMPLQHRQLSGNHQQSMAYILGQHDEPMEPDDPRITGISRKSAEVPRPSLGSMSSSQTAGSSSSSLYGDGKARLRGRSIAHFMDPVKNAAILNGSLGAGTRKRRYHSSIEADIEHRRKFVLKMARALMLFGAPSHRVESQLNALASTLSVDAQFIHFPGIVITSFGDCETNTSQCRFVKSRTAIALGRLSDLHGIYRHVMSDKISVADAAQQLDVLLKSPPEWSNLSRILFSTVKCGMMAPINFGGSFVDIWISALFGGILTFSQLCLAGNNEMFSNVFDIAIAILFSFLARLLSAKSVFCYEAVASSGVIGLLPGYAILCASLELASKNMMTGSVRMVYAIIYSLFLGFSIAIGSELYYWVDPKARYDVLETVVKQTRIAGSFMLNNATTPYWNGTFTFTDGTVDAQSIGAIGCVRMDNWPWWRQSVPAVSKAVTVPIFSLLSCLSFLHPLFSRETPVSVVIACIGYAANTLANKYIFDRSDVVSAIGAFVIGLLGNAYSRIWNATAFTSITVAVNFLVPSGLAMAGGLAMTHKGSDGDLYSNGLSLGFRMVQVSIGITTGLFVSALLVHMLGNKRSNAVLFAF